jgi:hypothetical protein
VQFTWVSASEAGRFAQAVPAGPGGAFFFPRAGEAKHPAPRATTDTAGAEKKSMGHTCGWRLPQGNTTRTP